MGSIIWVGVDHVEQPIQPIQASIEQAESHFVKTMWQAVQLKHDNPEAPEYSIAGIEQHRPFMALDIHLQQQIANRLFAKLILDPRLKSGRLGIVDNAQKFLVKFDERMSNWRTFDRCVGKEAAYASIDDIRLKTRGAIYTGRKTRFKLVKIIGNEIAAIAIAAKPHQFKSRFDRMQS